MIGPAKPKVAARDERVGATDERIDVERAVLLGADGPRRVRVDRDLRIRDRTLVLVDHFNFSRRSEPTRSASATNETSSPASPRGMSGALFGGFGAARLADAAVAVS